MIGDQEASELMQVWERESDSDKNEVMHDDKEVKVVNNDVPLTDQSAPSTDQSASSTDRSTSSTMIYSIVCFIATLVSIGMLYFVFAKVFEQLKFDGILVKGYEKQRCIYLTRWGNVDFHDVNADVYRLVTIIDQESEPSPEDVLVGCEYRLATDHSLFEDQVEMKKWLWAWFDSCAGMQNTDSFVLSAFSGARHCHVFRSRHNSKRGHLVVQAFEYITRHKADYLCNNYRPGTPEYMQCEISLDAERGDYLFLRLMPDMVKAIEYTQNQQKAKEKMQL